MSDEGKPFSRPKGPRGRPAEGKRPQKSGYGKKPERPQRRDEADRGAARQERRAEKPARDDPRPRRAGRPFENERRPGRREREESERKRPSSPGRVETSESEPGERIAKRLARAGVSSRRDAEALIAAGRVKVNGKVLASPAFNVRRSDVIELDGAEIPAIERTRLFLFHKPAGVVTTNRDPEGRKTVFDILPKDLPRLMTVGRLDINTEGLLLLTNDGGLSRVLELPSTGWLRRYRVRVHGKVDLAALEGLKQGIAVGGVFYGAIEASLDREQGSNAWLTLALREGKNREVKNVLGALGLEVSRLIRVSYGPFQLGDLPKGAVLELKGRTLRDQLGQRLVEESGADFSAPVVTAFSNRPVRQKREEPPPAEERPKTARRDSERGAVGEGGLIKSRKRQREDKRENALGRLQTSRPERPRNFGRGGKPDEREKRREEPQRSRSSNVWMAPGARPAGKKAEGYEASARSSGRPEKGSSRPGKRNLDPAAEKRRMPAPQTASPSRGEAGPAKRRPGEAAERKSYRKTRDDGHPSAPGKGGPRKPRRDG